MDALYSIESQPGIRHDGPELDSPFYSDSVWVRFQRGKPRNEIFPNLGNFTPDLGFMA